MSGDLFPKSSTAFMDNACRPASCEEAMLWGDLVQKGADEAWLHGNAKRCPACHKWIERSSGVSRVPSPSCVM